MIVFLQGLLSLALAEAHTLQYTMNEWTSPSATDVVQRKDLLCPCCSMYIPVIG